MGSFPLEPPIDLILKKKHYNLFPENKNKNKEIWTCLPTLLCSVYFSFGISSEEFIFGPV